jgi:hypothetical protein
MARGTGNVRNVYTILAGKPEGSRIFGRARRRCKDNSKMGLKNSVRVLIGLKLLRTGSNIGIM